MHTAKSTRLGAGRTCAAVLGYPTPRAAHAQATQSSNAEPAATTVRVTAVPSSLRAAAGTASTSRRHAERTYGDSLVSKLVTGTQGVDAELFGLSVADCRRLTTSLKQAKSWQDLSALLPCTQQEWAGVDTICLTAAFSSLARIAARGPSAAGPQRTADPISRAEMGAALRLMTQLALPRLQQFDGQGLVTMAVCLAKMQEYYTAHTPLQRAGAGAVQTIGALSAVLGRTTAAAYGASPTSSPAPPASVSPSTSSAPSPSPAASPSSSAPPLRDVVETLLSHSRVLMPRFQPQSLANLIWALATLGYPPCGAWLTEYYRRLDAQLGSLGSRDVCNILWSLCKLDLMPDIWLRDGLVERCLQAVKEQQLQQQQQLTAGAAAAAGPGPTARSPPTSVMGQERATLIQCLARWYFLYNYRVPDEWIAQYLALVLPALGQYSAFDLVSVVHSCVVMNHQPSRGWMAGYCVHALRSLKHDPTLSYSDLQRLMWAMSRIDYTPPLTWQREFVAATVPKLQHLNVRALTETVWALSCWSCRPSPEWLAAYFTVSGPSLAEAQPQHISCQLSALAKLEVKAPGPWLDQALDSFVDQLADVKAHDLVTLLDTIPVLCKDRSWIMQRTDTIKQLADTAASKFAVYDAVMHTKLCLALAAANVCPAADWWKKQQAALVACLRGGDAQSQAAVPGLMEVYQTWNVEVDTELKPYL